MCILKKILETKREITEIKNLPDNWRDTPPGSDEWRRMGQLLPNRAKEMRDWAHGPVLVCGDTIPHKEKFMLGSSRRYDHFIGRTGPWTFELLFNVIREANKTKHTLCYFRDKEIQLAPPFNNLLSVFDWNIRCRNRLQLDTELKETYK